VSAWRNFGEFWRRSSLRAWLSEIASSRRLGMMLRADSHRPRVASSLPEVIAPKVILPKVILPAPAVPSPVPPAPALVAPALPEPIGVGEAPPWLEPYPDHLLDVDRHADQTPGPRVRYDSAEAISLGFITALQLLPPRQRAALVLCDVVGYDVAEVADMLDTTHEAVDNSLTCARVTVDNRLDDSGSTCSGSSSTDFSSTDFTSMDSRSNGTGANTSRRPARQPDATAEHRLVARFTDALEHADLDALIDLLHADVKLSMPPAMLEYRGIDSAQRVFAAVTFRHGRSYRAVPTRANGQPAFGLYLADPHASVYRAYAFLVIAIVGDHITGITAFTANVMARFGLPRTLPAVE